MKQKSKLTKFNIFLCVVLVIVLGVNIFLISRPEKVVDDGGATEEDVAVIDEFAAGTYGGVSFASIDDVVAYYNAAYDKTKGETREYIDDQGNTAVWYSLLGEESLEVTNIMIEGKENSMINNLVPGVVGGLYSPGLNGLSPCENRDPNLDVDEEGAPLTTSRLTAEDVLAANVKDNGDGTITLQIQPVMVNMSHKGADAQGHLFTTLGAIDETVDSISVLSWASGTTAENCVVNYQGGYATVTIDTTSGLVTTADYHMEAHIAVSHASVAVLKDKSATLLVNYDIHFPASDEYLMNTKGAKVK